MKIFKAIVPMAVVLALFDAAPVLAQAQTPSGAEIERPLSVTASTFAGYDTDITSRRSRPSVPGSNVDSGAASVGASLNLSYAGGSPKVSYYTAGSTEYRYYRATEAVLTPLASGSVGIGAAMGRRARFNASVRSTYYPRFQLSLLPPTTDIPVDEPHPTQDFGISSYDVVSYQGTAGISYQLTTRSSLAFNYGQGQFRYLGQDYELNTQSVSGRYSQRLTRYATLQLGYGQMEGDYSRGLNPTETTVRRRTIDAGIDYSRPLSLSRRTRVGFTTGSTALDNGTRTFYTLTGSANLNHQLSRTWNLGVAYSRRVGLIGGFAEPIFSDATSASVGGAVGGGAFASLSAGYTNGKVGLASRGRNYNSVQSSANITVPITRRLAAFGTYFYYRHMFEESVSLPIGLVPRVDRQGVRAGLSLKIY